MTVASSAIGFDTKFLIAGSYFSSRRIESAELGTCGEPGRSDLAFLFIKPLIHAAIMIKQHVCTCQRNLRMIRHIPTMDEITDTRSCRG
eukprot:SAG31_NODE_3366_length_4358_cov_2.048133_4_plen_89_part_00